MREECSYLLYNLICGWIPKAICVNNLLPIKENAELAKPALDRPYLYVLFFVQLSCHTGSQGFLDRSDRTIVDGYFFHGLDSISDSQPTQSANRKSPRYVAGCLPSASLPALQTSWTNCAKPIAH